MNDTNWKALFRQVEREFDGHPPTPSPAQLRAQLAAERRQKERREERAAMLGVWSRLALVAILGAALHFWPYARDCGTGLFAYMGSEALVVLGGLWVMSCTWRCRIASAHALAMGLVLWGLALGSAEVLPRVGYAKTESGNPPPWWCAGR